MYAKRTRSPAHLLLLILVVLLLAGCDLLLSPPEADFTTNVTRGSAPLTVQFTDASTNITDQSTWAWEFGDGAASNEQNPSHTYTQAGTFTVSLVASNQKGFSEEPMVTQIEVSPGALARLSLSPESATLDIGATQQYTVQASDEYDNEISDLALSWQVVGDAGSIDSTGLLTTGTTAGYFADSIRVRASQDDVVREAVASIEVNTDPLASVVVSPLAAVLPVDSSQEFTATALDQYGNEIETLSVTWDVINQGGSVDDAGLFTAGDLAGLFEDTVQAESTQGDIRATDAASVTISPGPLASVVIEQRDVSLAVDETQQYTAKTFDQYGNEIEGLSFTWSVTQDGGTISDDGLFTAGTLAAEYVDTVVVETTQGDIRVTDTVSLSVTPGPLASVVIEQRDVSLAVDETQQYTAKTFDQYGNEIEGLSLTWSVAQGGGAIDDTGLFIAGTLAGAFPDTVRAEARQQEITASGAASVVVTSGPLASVVIEGGLTLAVDETQQYTAKGLDEYGNAIAGLTYSWTLLAGGGTLTTDGLFIAGNVPGTYRGAVQVQTSQGETSVSSTNSIIVTPGPLAQVVLGPTPADIGMGMTQHFVAVGADRYGNRIAGLSFTWNVEAGGGTIDDSGLFTARSIPGTYSDTVTAEATRAGVTVSGTATVTVEPDRIAFRSDRNDNQYDIYVMNADGASVQRLTGGADIGLPYPSWSPDGRRIVYDDCRGLACDIVVMTDDGSWKFILTSGIDGYPAWSPRGDRILFLDTVDEQVDIYVMEVDGGNVTRLTDTSADEWVPTWSPDGRQIVFTRQSGEEDTELYVMNADGSNVRRLTNNAVDEWSPQWSPDGSEIVFQSFEAEGQYWGVYVIEADGDDRERLTPDTAGYSNPSWSPDGQRILFASWRDDTDEPEIYVMNRDGTNIVRLTDNTATDWSPRWAPRKRGVEVTEDSIVVTNTADTATLSVAQVTAQASDVVVRVVTDLGSGSGFIFDADGLILTNNHVVSTAKEITVYLSDGTSYTATIRGRDLVHDLAVLKIDATGLPWLEIANLRGLDMGAY